MLKNRSIPFGYCMINGRYALNAVEAEAVRKIFEEYINGKSLKTIASEMQIPYNSSKPTWNKNMVCRVIENSKYTGECGYPQIVSTEDFEQAAHIKAERNTYRKPDSQDEPEQNIRTESQITEYVPTEGIQRMTDRINLLLESDDPNRNNVEELIIELAQQKYSAVSEVKL